MKRLFILLAFVVGCATVKPAYHSQMKEDVYLDHESSWSNSPVKYIFGKRSSPIRSVTLRLINKKYVDVSVSVMCTYSDATKFGERTVTVKERNDKVFTIYGFVKLTDESESVSCRIISVK